VGSPHLLTVADRIWSASWQGRAAREDILERLQNVCLSDNECALCALDGERFAGTVLVIASDLDERPQYSPWVAALWVEPAYRQRGIGAKLVQSALAEAWRAGNRTAYLCAHEVRRDYYVRLGWTEIERDVGSDRLCVFSIDVIEAGLQGTGGTA
jgi:predicted N-acetyltransferase YhbS